MSVSFLENLSYDKRLGDERHDAELSRALGVNERVDFKHPADEMGLSASKAALRCGLKVESSG